VPEGQRGRKTRVALLSVASNSTLVLFKLVVGLLIGSVSVISEAVHSGVDLIASLIALFAVRTAGKPADEGHPFGHGKVENISGTIEALLIFGAAAYIIFEAVKKLLHPTAVESLGWGVTVMGISAVANFFVSRMLFKVGRETQSVALEADGWHLRTDVYTSVGVMTGLAFMWGAQLVFPTHDWEWVDPVVAMGIALLIIRAAYQLTVNAARDLLDVSLPEEELWIREYIAGLVPPVRGFHHMRTRRAGHVRFVEFHMLVDGEMTVDASHAITDVISRDIREQFPESSVTVHIEPCDGTCEQVCIDGCYLNDEMRETMQERLVV
jgi:cation diffusion facilitator family transporter